MQRKSLRNTEQSDRRAMAEKDQDNTEQKHQEQNRKG